MVRRERYRSPGNAFTGFYQCRCRLGVPQEEGLERLESVNGSFCGNIEPVQSGNGSLFLGLERQVGQVCNVETTARILGNERDVRQLVGSLGLCVPSFQSNIRMFGQIEEGGIIDHSSVSSLEEPAVVSSAPPHVSGHPAHVESAPHLLLSPTGTPHPLCSTPNFRLVA